MLTCYRLERMIKIFNHKTIYYNNLTIKNKRHNKDILNSTLNKTNITATTGNITNILNTSGVESYSVEKRKTSKSKLFADFKDKDTESNFQKSKLLPILITETEYIDRDSNYRNKIKKALHESKHIPRNDASYLYFDLNKFQLAK